MYFVLSLASFLSHSIHTQVHKKKFSPVLYKKLFLFFRPVFKPFASSIPSLRSTPGDTDTDSVDSVEAAIQAAMRKKGKSSSTLEITASPHRRILLDA